MRIATIVPLARRLRRCSRDHSVWASLSARGCHGRKARPDVFFGAVRREPHRAGSAANKKITLGRRFDPLPFQEYGLRAALTGHDADRLVLDPLHLWIDASARPIAKPVANQLR